MSNPSYKPCKSCEDTEALQFVEVPTCNSESNDPCVSNKGKFFDRLTEDFVVPSVGRTSKIKVCDGKLWSKCLWVAACIGAEKIAAFQITETSNKSITILNGCRTGEAIQGNPDVGYEIKEGTVIYPIPPQGCSQGFCAKVAQAIEECGADAVINVLKESEEICFTSVPVLDEIEKAHLFGGIMPDQDCQCDDYGYAAPVQGETFWQSCLRKLNRIFTNVGGRTLCMPEVPTYDYEDDPSNLAREAVFDKKGCLRKGNAVGDCRNATAIEDSETGADAVIVCKDGARRILVPDCNTMIVGCCEDGETDPKWAVKPKGLNLFLLDEPIEVYNSAWLAEGATSGSSTTLATTITETITIDSDLIPASCGNVSALVDFQSTLVDTASASVVVSDVFYNDKFYRKVIAGLTNEPFASFTQDIVPLNESNPESFKFKWDKLSGTAYHRTLVRILGFYA